MGSIAGSTQTFDMQFPDEESNRIGAAQALRFQEERKQARTHFVDLLRSSLLSIENHLSRRDTLGALEQIQAARSEAGKYSDGFPVSVLCSKLALELECHTNESRSSHLLRMLEEECLRIQRSAPYCSKELVRMLTEHLAETQGVNSSYRHFLSATSEGEAATPPICDA